MLPVCPLQVRICDTACHTWQMERAEEIPIFFLINMLKIKCEGHTRLINRRPECRCDPYTGKIEEKEYHTRYTSIF